MGLPDQWLNEAQAYGSAVKDRVNHLQGFPARFMQAPKCSSVIGMVRAFLLAYQLPRLP